MTSIVAVLNKHAVAIAADSAVTMGNIHKVVNSANKIFTLSKYHPVAVMTYNNAAFMGTPWDIIIKEYRKQLRDKSFPIIDNYVQDFIKFMHTRHFFCDELTQQEYLISILDSFYNICCNELHKDNGAQDLTLEQIENKLRLCRDNNRSSNRCPEFDTYTLDDFTKYAGNYIKEYADTKEFKDTNLLIESFYFYLSAKLLNILDTGLVFVGYGEEEIYPSLIPINISLDIDNHLKYYIDENNVARITEHGLAASITPFAQIDVTQTIVKGIHPNFQNIISNVIGNSLKSFSNNITDILDKGPGNEGVSFAIKKLNLDSIIQKTILDINQTMKQSYTDPLLKTVISLNKEDMANMAESFISLTSLIRRMQPGEETVGGPVDVAVISKGDGFIWINRKHYFKPELNASFFSNYFK